MTSKKAQPVKKIEETLTEQPVKQESKNYTATRNFFFAGKNWMEGEIIDLPQTDLDFLVSKEVIH
jgi:hypothetical protein